MSESRAHQGWGVSRSKCQPPGTLPWALILIWGLHGTQSSPMSHHWHCFWVRMTPEAKRTSLHCRSSRFLFLSLVPATLPPSTGCLIAELSVNIGRAHLWSCCCSKHFAEINSLIPQHNSISLDAALPPSHRQRLWSLEESRSLAQGDTDYKQKSWGSQPGSPPRDSFINWDTTLVID